MYGVCEGFSPQNLEFCGLAIVERWVGPTEMCDPGGTDLVGVWLMCGDPEDPLMVTREK